jgi:hypothetical protein
MTTDQQGFSGGSDYGYDLAHDADEARRRPPDQPGRPGERAAPPGNHGGGRCDHGRDSGGDYGYDEAHDAIGDVR